MEIEFGGKRVPIIVRNSVAAQKVPPAGVAPEVTERMRRDAEARGEIFPDLAYTQIEFDCPVPLNNGMHLLHKTLAVSVYPEAISPPIELEVWQNIPGRNGAYRGRYYDVG